MGMRAHRGILDGVEDPPVQHALDLAALQAEEDVPPARVSSATRLGSFSADEQDGEAKADWLWRNGGEPRAEKSSGRSRSGSRICTSSNAEASSRGRVRQVERPVGLLPGLARR